MKKLIFKYVLNMKKGKTTALILGVMGILLFSLHSCKKGCTDYLAYNYNENKTSDNGSCSYYSTITLSSVDVKTIPEYNNNGVIWDGGNGSDLDDDNSYPDLYLTFKAEDGYAYEPSTYFPSVQPDNVNKTQSLTPISISDWENKTFWVFFYETDYSGYHLELIDSVEVEPFLNEGDGANRFRDTLEVTKGGISFTANMQWE